LLVRELGTDDVCILIAWQRLAIRLGELWNAHIALAKENGDIGFIREQEAAAELRQLCATLPPNSMFGPKSPAERAAPRDSLISWVNYETVGGYCQHVKFSPNGR
jgi:hypothetical protein